MTDYVINASIAQLEGHDVRGMGEGETAQTEKLSIIQSLLTE